MGEILPGGVVRVEIGDEWYDLRQHIGWFSIQEHDPQSAANLKISLPAGIVQKMGEGAGLADLDPDTPVGIQMPGPEVTLRRLKARLCGWSYKTTLTESNVKRLPPVHVDRLLAECDALDAAEREANARLDDGHPFGTS